MKEALKLALEALKKTQSEGYNLPSMAISEAILVAEAVLAQPEQSTTCGEPVAWQVEMFIDGAWVPLGNPQRNKTRAEALASNPSLPKEQQRIFPLYTTPPQPKPLTDKQLNIIGSRWHLNLLGADEKAELFAFARAVEAAHGIKENT